ncbi:MAG TPA: SBBP repeat-containing protein [Thermoanaerobaculia bacterium]|nr:SBBP repeat-containing protein [Thermoanaerobaculia bacterium]
MTLSHRVSLLVLSLFVVVTSSARSTAVDSYGKVPLRFERNDGQTAPEVAYLSRGRGGTLYLTRTEAVLSLRRDEKSAVLRLRMTGANADAAIAGEELLPGRSNYFVGNDRRGWRTGVPSYRRVRYDDVWPGVDLVWHGTQNALEYDFVVAPGVDPSKIRLTVDGAKRLRLDPSGNLIAETAAGDVVQHAPVLYQDGANGRTPVAGKYVLRGKKDVGFAIGSYDPTRTLVIDPVLEYSTYLGGLLNEEAFGVAIDAQANAYVTGPTDSLDFPRADGLTVEKDALVFIAKLNADGSDLVYSTFIGAGHASSGLTFEEGSDLIIATGIAVTAAGRAVITGGIDNTNDEVVYPTTPNAFQASQDCLGLCSPAFGDPRIDSFVTMLNEAGDTLVYSTLFGGEKLRGDSFDRADAVALDATGRIYIAGSSNSDDLPMEKAFQSLRRSSDDGLDAFIAVFNPGAEKGRDSLLYSSFLGGEDDDHGLAIAVDGDRNAYVAGKTLSLDLKTKAPAGQSLPPLQETFQGGSLDGFIAKIDTESKGNDSLTYLTYFGGDRNDRIEGVAVDGFQRAYIAGATSSLEFPLINAFDTTQSNGEGFVAKLNADGTALFYSSFLGGQNTNTPDDFEEATAIAIDPVGNAYVAGNTSSAIQFPVGLFEPPLPQDQRGTAFVAKVGVVIPGATVPPLVYATTFGGKNARVRGIAADADDHAFVAGFTDGDFTVANAFQPDLGGGRDAFVTRFASVSIDTTGLYDGKSNTFQLRNFNTPGGANEVVPLGKPGDLPVVGDWDGDGITDLGVFSPEEGQFMLRLGSGIIVAFIAGNALDLPVAGDWDGDGFDTVGLFRNGGRTGQSFFLTNARVEPFVNPDFDIIVPVGQAGDLPLAGDWNDDGVDTPGFYRPAALTFNLMDDFSGTVTQSFLFGVPGDLPIAGDWNGIEGDDVGIYRPSSGTMRLTIDAGLSETFVFELQAPGTRPVAGNWDGR